MAIPRAAAAFACCILLQATHATCVQPSSVLPPLVLLLIQTSYSMQWAADKPPVSDAGCLNGVITTDASKSDDELLAEAKSWSILGKDLISEVHSFC